MTKEEFLTMLNSEIEKLELEFKLFYKRALYFQELKPNGDEAKEANYLLRLTQSKLNSLKHITGLPAYTRIMAMSNTEIDEFKQELITEIEEKIKQLELEIPQKEKELHDLIICQDELIETFDPVVQAEKDRTLTAGKELSSQISKLSCQLKELQYKVEKLKQEKEKTKAKTAAEIKNELASKIPNKSLLEQLTKVSSADSSAELLAAVAEDYEKAEATARLMAQYQIISNRQNSMTETLYLSSGLPQALRKKLTSSWMYYKDSTGELSNPDKLLEIINKFEETFKQAKQNFNEQVTEQKLSKLVGKEFGVYTNDVDMDFLQQHDDKLTDNSLTTLQNLVVQRDKLTRKIFKTSSVKLEISDLNKKIISLQSKIYQTIINWYRSIRTDILGTSIYFSFSSIQDLDEQIKVAMKHIDYSQEAITNLKKTLESKKLELAKRSAKVDVEKEIVANKIRTLAGNEYAQANMPYTDTDTKRNLDSIITASTTVKRNEIAEKVQQEANTQADMKEADIKGITLEKLRELREKMVPENNESEKSPIQKQ